MSRLVRGEDTKIKDLTEAGPPGPKERDDGEGILQAKRESGVTAEVLRGVQTGGSSTRDGSSSAIPEDSKTRPQLQRQPVDDKSRIAAIKAAIIANLTTAATMYAQANARFSQLSGGAPDPAIVEIVQEQGGSVKENLDRLTALAPTLAAMPESKRRTILGAGAIELQQFITNTDHLLVLHRVVNKSVPDVFDNKEEVEDRLDEFAEWHESWIDANIDVGDFAGDLVGVGLDLQEQTEVSQPVAEHFADYQSRLQQQAATLSRIGSWLDELDAEIQKKEWKAGIKRLLEKVDEILSYFPTGKGRKAGRPKRKPRTKADRAKGAKERQQKREKKKKKKKERRGLRWNLGYTSEIARLSGCVPGTLDTKAPLPKSAPIHAHHVWPKYVGGPEIQPLMSVREIVHQGVIHTTIHTPLITAAAAMGFPITQNGQNLAFKAHLKVNLPDREKIAAILKTYYAALSTRTDPGIPPRAYLEGISVSQKTM